MGGKHASLHVGWSSLLLCGSFLMVVGEVWPGIHSEYIFGFEGPNPVLSDIFWSGGLTPRDFLCLPGMALLHNSYVSQDTGSNHKQDWTLSIPPFQCHGHPTVSHMIGWLAASSKQTRIQSCFTAYPDMPFMAFLYFPYM